MAATDATTKHEEHAVAIAATSQSVSNTLTHPAQSGPGGELPTVVLKPTSRQSNEHILETEQATQSTEADHAAVDQAAPYTAVQVSTTTVRVLPSLPNIGVPGLCADGTSSTAAQLKK